MQMMDVRPQQKALCIIADGFGLSPGVDQAILQLLAAGKISGTSCMTLFGDWKEEASLLLPVAQEMRSEIGLHLTLTTYKPLSGVNPMCKLSKRLVQCYLGGVDRFKLKRELDAQLNAFIDVIGRVPDFIDGHQHVHFLPVVREWLQERRELLISPRGTSPWLRGEPHSGLTQGMRPRGRLVVVEQIARGFDDEMRGIGYQVKGPLIGFYERRNPKTFRAMLERWHKKAPANAVMMCHPGHVDKVLNGRDRFISSREVEFAELMRL